jgi:hypothetical protein
MKHLVQPTANASRRKKRGKITRLTKSRSKIIMYLIPLLVHNRVGVNYFFILKS